MSLNGLEDAKVLEAFEGACAEPGGWYETSIDTILPRRATMLSA